MLQENKKIPLRQAGFSLVEILVGLVIGLLATLVIMQVFSVFEGQKRSTSGNADAQTNGSIALMSLQRDLQMAGFGLPLPMADKLNTSLKCNAFPDFDPDNNPATDNSTNISPIVIQDGVGPNASDSVTVRYSATASMGAVPVKVSNTAAVTAAPGIAIENNIGCMAGNIVMISNGTICSMATIANPNGIPDLTHIILAADPLVAGALVPGAKLACMGNWQDYRYEVVNNELRLNGNPIVAEVVNLQAQYGVSAVANSNQVNEWVNATGIWAAPTVDNRNRIKAARVVVVVRNGLLEKENVTNACTTNKGTVNNGPCAWDDTDYSAAPAIDLSGIPDWQRYRYRSFETIIPLRNMLWSKDVL